MLTVWLDELFTRRNVDWLNRDPLVKLQNWNKIVYWTHAFVSREVTWDVAKCHLLHCWISWPSSSSRCMRLIVGYLCIFIDTHFGHYSFIWLLGFFEKILSFRCSSLWDLSASRFPFWVNTINLREHMGCYLLVCTSTRYTESCYLEWFRFWFDPWKLEDLASIQCSGFFRKVQKEMIRSLFWPSCVSAKIIVFFLFSYILFWVCFCLLTKEI